MKKLYIIILIELIVSITFANTSRIYTQKIVSPLFDLPSTYVSNQQEIKNINYLFTATITNSPDTLSTKYDFYSSISVFDFDGNAIAFIDLGAFENQWKMDDTLHCTITFTLDGKYKGQSTSWDYIIPDESDSPMERLKQFEEIPVPPFELTSKPTVNQN
jgi:hypothetical protein